MKPKLIFACIITLCFVSSDLKAQYEETRIIPTSGGKYNMFTFSSATQPEQPLLITSEQAFDPRKKDQYVADSKEGRQLYHIIFHFDKHPSTVICNSPDTVYYSMDMTWINTSTLEAYMEEGYYDLICTFPKEPYPPNSVPRIVYKELFHVWQDMDTTILTMSACYSVTLNSYDENNTLISPEAQPGQEVGYILEFPENYMMNFMTAHYIGYGINKINVSDVPPYIKLVFARFDVQTGSRTGDGLYHFYTVSFPVQQGVSSSIELENDYSELGMYDFVFQPSPAYEEGFLSFSTGVIANSLLVDPGYAVVGSSCDDYPVIPGDTCKMYSSLFAIDTNMGIYTSGILFWESDPTELSSYNRFVWPFFNYVDENNMLVFASEGNYPAVEGDYCLPESFRAIIDHSAPYNETASYNIQDSTLLWMAADFFGQANDTRKVDLTNGYFNIYRDEQLIASQSPITGPIMYSVPTSDAYTLVITDTNYLLAGIKGRVEATLNFDLTKSDPNAPRLTALRIEQNGYIRPFLNHQDDATLKFTAGDFIYNPWQVYSGLEDISVYYKEHSDTVWIDLAVTEHTALLDSFAGMPYSSDLYPLIKQFPDSTWVDLKIDIYDLAGNTTIQTISPAFMILDFAVSIHNLSQKQSISLFPNPAGSSVTMTSSSCPIDIRSIRIFNSSGKEVWKENHPKTLPQSIDLSFLDAGIYYLSVYINGQWVTEKVIHY
jgi:hypothetical protein